MLKRVGASLGRISNRIDRGKLGLCPFLCIDEVLVSLKLKRQVSYYTTYYYDLLFHYLTLLTNYYYKLLILTNYYEQNTTRRIPLGATNLVLLQ